MKELFMVVSGALGAIAYHLIGRWDSLLEAMIVLMIIDVVTGVMVAAWFKKSDKSHDGRLWSHAMYRGMCKKGMGLFFVIIGCQLDHIVEREYIRSAVVFCVIANELLSIIENAAVMGVPIPEIMKRMLTVLNDKIPEKAADKYVEKAVEKMGSGSGNNGKKDGDGVS